MSPTTKPKADNRRVTTEYSQSMKKLLARRTYNAGRRPSQHSIGQKSFLIDNGGAIPPNVLSISNTRSGDPYQRYCRANGLTPHPARMASKLAPFFVEFLTEPGDLVLDPFAGSNTTGSVAEQLSRKWLSIEAEDDYATASASRFVPPDQRASFSF